jgi:hypothetical protein
VVRRGVILGTVLAAIALGVGGISPSALGKADQMRSTRLGCSHATVAKGGRPGAIDIHVSCSKSISDEPTTVVVERYPPHDKHGHLGRILDFKPQLNPVAADRGAGHAKCRLGGRVLSCRVRLSASAILAGRIWVSRKTLCRQTVAVLTVGSHKCQDGVCQGPAIAHPLVADKPSGC